MSPRHRIHANPFTVRGEIDVPEWTDYFGRQAPFALDVGFGRGMFALELAKTHPQWNIVGVEIREHLVEELLGAAKDQGLSNVGAILANINTHLEELVPDGSVRFVALNFPDPWYKKRHHKRRVVQPEWLTLLAKKMTPDGEFHIMTDFEPQAEEIREHLETHEAFQSCHPDLSFAAESTTGIQTEREITHAARGDVVYRLQFRRHHG